MGLRWADPCTGAKYDASCKSYTRATARMNLQFCKTVISHMFVCCSLSQRAAFGNPWNSTPGLQQDGVIVTGVLFWETEAVV